MCFFFQAEDGIRAVERSRGLGDVYKRQDYWGILRYLGDQYGVPYVVQPLPVADFSACLVGEDSVRLACRP